MIRTGKKFIHKAKPLTFLGLSSFLFLCIGCSIQKSLKKDLVKQVESLEKFRKQEFPAESTSVIKWREAKGLLVANNIALQQTRRNLKQASDRRKRYWRNYIPGLRGSASLNQSLFNFDEIRLDDISVSAFLSVKIPNPVTVNSELKGLHLAEYRAKFQYTLQERQLIIQLYRLFTRYRTIEKQLQDLSSTKVRDQLESNPSLNIANKIESRSRQKIQQDNLLEQRRAVLLQLSNLLQSDKLHVPLASSLPKLNYRSKSAAYFESSSYGRLALKLIATNLEASRLSIQRTKIKQFPSLSLSASAPQLYSSNADRNRFDYEAISLFGSINDGIDWSRSVREEIAYSEEDYRYAIKNAQSKIRNDKEIIRRAFKKLKRLSTEREKLLEIRRSLKKFLKNKLQPQSFLENYQQFEELQKKIEQLDFQIREQELEFWLWDGPQWN